VIEARVYAEDPARGFLPQAGRILLYREPRMPGIRVDSGVEEGSDVPLHYDPLLAKVIATGETRDETITRLVCALREYPILGVRTNIPFLIRVLDHPRFRAGDVDTGFLDARRRGARRVRAWKFQRGSDGGAAHESESRRRRSRHALIPGRASANGARDPHRSGVYRVNRNDEDDGGKRRPRHRVCGRPPRRTWAFWNGRVFRPGLPADQPGRPRSAGAIQR
jgi:acetyl/propionyl-CoA carboxylase alpha subunit